MQESSRIKTILIEAIEQCLAPKELDLWSVQKEVYCKSIFPNNFKSMIITKTSFSTIYNSLDINSHWILKIHQWKQSHLLKQTIWETSDSETAACGLRNFSLGLSDRPDGVNRRKEEAVLDNNDHHQNDITMMTAAVVAARGHLHLTSAKFSDFFYPPLSAFSCNPLH